MKLVRSVGLACANLAVAVGVAGLAGCSPGPATVEESRPPVASERDRVIDRVEAIPGVAGTDLQVRDDATSGQSIMGSVEVSPQADPVAVLDDVYAALWTFRSWPPPITVVATVGDQVFGLDGPLPAGSGEGLTKSELEQRYGPWPGDV